MAVVDHDQGVVLLGQRADLVELGNGAVHAEGAVGGDDAIAGALAFLELGFEIGHVVGLVDVALGLAEADAIDDRGVVQRVGDDGVLLRKQRLEQPAVGVETGRIQDRVLGMEEIGDHLFELLVDVLRAADKADAAHAVAVCLQGFVGGLDDPGCDERPEVVVRAEVDHALRRAAFRILDFDIRRLGCQDKTLFLEQAGLTNRGQFLLQVIFHFAVHVVAPIFCRSGRQTRHMPV